MSRKPPTPRPVVELSVPFSAYQALEARYDALVHELVALKRDGFSVPDSMPPPIRGEPLPSEVVAAISALTVDNPELEGQLVRAAWSLLRSGMSAPDVAQRITDGEPAEL